MWFVQTKKVKNEMKKCIGSLWDEIKGGKATWNKKPTFWFKILNIHPFLRQYKGARTSYGPKNFCFFRAKRIMFEIAVNLELLTHSNFKYFRETYEVEEGLRNKGLSSTSEKTSSHPQSWSMHKARCTQNKKSKFERVECERFHEIAQS